MHSLLQLDGIQLRWKTAVFSAGTEGRMIRMGETGSGVRKLECCFGNSNSNDNNENSSDNSSGKGAPMYHEPGTQLERNYPCVSVALRG